MINCSFSELFFYIFYNVFFYKKTNVFNINILICAPVDGCNVFLAALKTLTDLMTFVDIFLYISYSLSGCGIVNHLLRYYLLTCAQRNKNKRTNTIKCTSDNFQNYAYLTTYKIYNLLLSCMELTLLIQGTAHAQVCLFLMYFRS